MSSDVSESEPYLTRGAARDSNLAERRFRDLFTMNEEEELYVAVEETLESKGVLSMIRAQLRSAVFEAIIDAEVRSSNSA